MKCELQAKISRTAGSFQQFSRQRIVILFSQEFIPTTRWISHGGYESAGRKGISPHEHGFSPRQPAACGEFTQLHVPRGNIRILRAHVHHPHLHMAGPFSGRIRLGSQTRPPGVQLPSAHDDISVRLHSRKRYVFTMQDSSWLFDLSNYFVLHQLCKRLINRSNTC